MPRAGSKEALQLKVAKLEADIARLKDEARPPSEAMRSLPPAPEDTLGIQKHAIRMLALDLDEVKEDAALTPAQRRAERRAISDSIVRLVPNSRKFEAEQAIKEDREDLERVKRKGAELVPVPESKESKESKAAAKRVKGPRRKKEKKARAARRDAGAPLVPVPKP
jgi:hypothetical protein